MLYIAQTGCQWRYLPASFGPWTRVWSQFRRWSQNGTWAQALTVLHAAARQADGRAEETPSMVVTDAHLARGASNGGFTFHDRGGPYGRTKGAKRVVAVDVTGLPVAALVVPASTHENRASELMLEHLTRQGVTIRLELVLVDRGVTAAAARTLGRHHDLEVRRVGRDDRQPVFRPIRHAWRVKVAHGRLGRSRRLAKSFENTTISATAWGSMPLRASRDYGWVRGRDGFAPMRERATSKAPAVIAMAAQAMTATDNWRLASSPRNAPVRQMCSRAMFGSSARRTRGPSGCSNSWRRERRAMPAEEPAPRTPAWRSGRARSNS